MCYRRLVASRANPTAGKMEMKTPPYTRSHTWREATHGFSARMAPSHQECLRRRFDPRMLRSRFRNRGANGFILRFKLSRELFRIGNEHLVAAHDARVIFDA